MFSAQLSCFLTVFLFCSAAAAGAQKVITASRGDNVTLPCSSVFNYSDQVSVEWKKDGGSGFCKYRTINNTTTHHNCKPRFGVNTDPVGLVITDVTSSDAGVYNCTMLKLIPPPAEEGSLLLILHVNDLIVQQTNSSNLTCVELLCFLEGLSLEQVNFTWTRGSEQLLHQNSSSTMSSTLKLCKPAWRDGDKVTCSASYFSNTVYNSLLKSFTIKCRNSDCTETGGVPWLVIGSVVGACVVLFFIILCVVLYKCKKKKDGSGSIVFTNKIYENLSFFSSRTSAEPGVGLTPRTPARPNPQGECQPQREECIYEN